MSKAFKCDACGRYADGEPEGRVVTRRGLADPCSPECFMKLVRSPEACTTGDLDVAQRREIEEVAGSSSMVKTSIDVDASKKNVH